MAPITKTLALAGALFALSGVAAPVEKRAVVWETVTDIVWTTVDVTTTIYPNQGKPTATATLVAVTTTAAAEPTSSAAPVEEEAKAAPAPTTSTSEAPAPAPQPTETEQPTVQAQQAQAAPSAESSSSTTTAAAPAQTETRSAKSDSGSSSDSSASSSGYNGACSSGAPCVGEMTYYDTATLATNPSSCGTTNDGESEFVLALPVGIMTDADCGKSVTISYGGVTKTGKVVDKCMGCDDKSIDLSRALFQAFASFSEGRLTDAKWYIN